MQVKRLTLTNVRALEHAEFEFQPGVNLLVGVNGAGKSTVLDVLRIMFSQSLPRLTSAASRQAMQFDRQEDIRFGQPVLTVFLRFEVGERTLDHTVHLQREAYVANRQAATGEVRGQAIDLREYDELEAIDGQPIAKVKRGSGDHQPLVVYFSPQRSVIAQSRSIAGSRNENAYAGALETRGVTLRESALWWLAQEELAKEDSGRGALLQALKSAVSTFLTGYTNLRAVREPRTTLVLDKSNATLDVRQLSDGERGMIALILDLARRLALANPHSKGPLRECSAVVLIDEIDLHLHPGWQRTICERLIEIFPKCQFIATTHSPQVYGEVPPRSIWIIENGKATHPDQSLGMDSNWVLENAMNVDARRRPDKERLQDVSRLIQDEKYDDATRAIAIIRRDLGNFADLARLQSEVDLIRFLGSEMGSEDENK